MDLRVDPLTRAATVINPAHQRPTEIGGGIWFNPVEPAAAADRLRRMAEGT